MEVIGLRQCGIFLAGKEPSICTLQVLRVHKLYEEVGREDVREVQNWEKAEQKNAKDVPHQ